MTPNAAWAILGIEPTDDARLIRQAYARRLKAMDPDDDADAFHALLAARKTALAAAARENKRLGAGQGAAPGTRAEMSSPKMPAPEMPTPLPPCPDPSSSTLAHADEDAGPARPRISIIDTPLPEPPSSPEPPPRSAPPRRREPPSSRPSEVPRAIVLELAPFTEEEDHWAEARRLQPLVAACLAPLKIKGGRVDAAAFDDLLRQAGRLPLGPRETVERVCVVELGRGLRNASGLFDRRYALRIVPLLLAADAIFGWNRDDDVFAAVLPANDADAVALMLDETARQATPRRLRFAAHLRLDDARAFFSGRKPDLARVVRLDSPKPFFRRFNLLALLAPHVWALRRCLYGTALAFYVTNGLAIFLFSQVPATPLAFVGVVTDAAIFVAAGLWADRIMLAAALRSVRRANRAGIFDAQERKAYLARKGGWSRIFSLWTFAFTPLLLTPYAGFLFAFGILADWLGRSPV